MSLPVTPDIPTFDVSIKNWGEAGKPPVVANTTVKTLTVDPAAATTIDDGNGGRKAQIADYEPNRLRMVVQVIDAPVMLCKEKPTVSPDPSALATPGVGRFLPNSAFEYVFYGPDAWWINSVAAATRVTITKEYS